jgi:hypothetical protein
VPRERRQAEQDEIVKQPTAPGLTGLRSGPSGRSTVQQHDSRFRAPHSLCRKMLGSLVFRSLSQRTTKAGAVGRVGYTGIAMHLLSNCSAAQHFSTLLQNY